MDIFKRVGTKTVQYQIDIVLNKLYMNVNVPGCEISVILKRGDHKSETKAPTPLKDRTAKFNKQIISVPTKLYWDDKKKEFLSKNAELQINIVHQKKVRCAGKIEFDVASYATKNIKSMMEQRQLQKCPDTGAKLLYEIRVHEFGDYSYYQNKDDEDDNRNKSKSTNARGRDVSPMMDISGNTSARGQIQDLDQFNPRSKSPISKVPEQPKTVSFGRNQEYNTNGAPNSARGAQQQQDESQLRSNLFTNNKTDSSKYSTTNPSSSSYTNGYSSMPTNGLNGESGYNNKTSSNNNLPTQSPSNLSGSQKQQELINQNQMRDLFKQQKEDNMSLRQKVQELVTENDSLKQQVDTFKNENQRLKGKINALESQNGSSSNNPNDSVKKAHQQEIQSYEEQIKKLYEEIKSLKQQSLKDNKTEDLERQLKDLSNEQELSKAEITIKFEREKSLFEKKMKDLQLTVEELNQKLSENQNEIQRKQKDIDYYKGLVNRSNKEETDNEHMLNLQKQIQELSQKNATTEKEYKQKVKDLQEENQRIKKDRELEVIDLRRTKTESDHELGKLSRENDQLKKDIKEIQNKYNQSKAALQQYMNKEGNEVSSKSKEIQAKYDELNNNLKKISVERGNIEMERDNLKSYIKQKDEEINKLKYSTSSMENRLKNTKENLCEMLNVILMTGDKDLIDEVEPYLNEPEEPEYVPQNTSASMNQFTNSPNTLYTPTPFTFNNQFTNNLVSSEAKTNELYKSNNFSDKNFF